MYSQGEGRYTICASYARGGIGAKGKGREARVRHNKGKVMLDPLNI